MVTALPFSIALLSIGTGFLATIISLYYQAKAMALEASKQKRKLAKEIKRKINCILAVAVLAIIAGAILLQLYLNSLLRAPTG